MPNGDDRVRIEFNGQTGTVPRVKLQKYIDKGAKVIPTEKPNAFDRFSMDVTKGMGFEPQKLIQAYETGGGTGQLKEMGSEVVSGIGSLLKDPLSMFHGLASGFTSAAGLPDRPGEHFHAPVPGQLIGATANILGGAEGVKRAAGVPKPVIRDLLGVGERDVAKQIEKTTSKEAAAVEKTAKKVETAKAKYSDAVQENIQARAAASAKETAAKTKQEALASKHGPVYKRMNEMATDAQQHISKVEEAVNKAETAKWDAFNKKLGNPSVKTQPVVDAIRDVQKNILTGESVPVFNQMLGEIMEGAPHEFIDSAMGLAPKSPEIPLDLARRLYTKISRKLNGAELPKDMARALGKVQDVLDENIAESIVKKGNEMGEFAEKYNLNPRPPSAPGLVSFQDRLTGGSIEMKEGFTEAELADKLKSKRAEIGKTEPSDLAAKKAKEAKAQEIPGGPNMLREYRKLQADWARYRQTFSDKSSPLRKVMEAMDPNTKLNPIVGETGARAIDYLGRYADMGADPSKLGRIRAMYKALKELPSSGGKMPETPERPTLQKIPEAVRQTPEQARREMLTSKESFYSRPPSRWELMFPPLLMYKMGLKHLMQNPKFVDWLSREGKSTLVP